MGWERLIVGLVLSGAILIPLGIKWEIPRKTVFLGPLVVGVLAGLEVTLIGHFWELQSCRWLLLFLLLIAVKSVSFILWRFYRDPDRTPPGEKNVILSPADGKVIYVKEIQPNGAVSFEKQGRQFFLRDFVKCDFSVSHGFLVGISMNLLNVHVNRAPIEGTISLIRHIKGSFISLKRKEAMVENERALTVIDNGQFKVGVVQIASRLVRSIVLYHNEGSFVRRGERIGMIRFGSQVDVIIPGESFLEICVKPGQEVKAGLSILARIILE